MSTAYSADCRKIHTSCLDATPCKSISGTNVCLSDVGKTCWEEEDTYSCLKPNAVDYCQSLVDAGCWQTNSQCGQMDNHFGTGCMIHTQTYRCSDPNQTAPVNTTALSGSFTLISSDYQKSCTAPGSNCAVAENRCIQTTPTTPLPAGITNAQVAPDDCFQRETIYACTSMPSAQLSSCTSSSSTCIDTTPTKMVNGVTVTLAEVGGCWQYRDDCVTPLSVDFCAPLASSAQCRETASTCTQPDTTFNTRCMRYQKAYRCDNPDHPAPANTITLDDSYTLVSTGYNASACASYEGNSNCTLAEVECTSSTTPTLPPGITQEQAVPDGCQQITRTYACLSGVSQSDCDLYQSNPNCERLSSRCDEEDRINGQCIFQRDSYRCQTVPASTSVVVDCSGRQFCQNGNCIDTGYESDKDFGRAMVMMEATREAGVYGEIDSIFSGIDSRCTINQMGLSNCCKPSGGGGSMSNSVVMNTVQQVGSQTLKYGSAYAYDTLFSTSAPNWVVDGLGSMAGASANYGPGMAASTFSPTFSMYGFTATTGTLTAGVTPLGSIGGVQFGFDPYTLALQVAIMVVMEMMSCEPHEQIVSMALGEKLCHEVGSYCSKKVLKQCITRTVTHCCYNSRLARIINEQGRDQIGKGWGTATDPDCSGFTMSEMESLDFSRMDMSDFVTEVMSQVSLPNKDGISNDTMSSVNNRFRNYYERGSQ